MTILTPNLNDQWLIVRSLFEAAASLASVSQKAFLDFACPCAEIRKEVELLLAADQHVDSSALPADRIEEVSASAAQPTPVIAGYRLDEIIGMGGSGTVYSAISIEQNRRVAIKVMHAHSIGRPAAIRFRQECTALARLSHPNIVRLIESGICQSGNSYLVMEFISGTPADQWATKCKPSVGRAIEMIQCVLSALAHSHHAGIVHRDIKPSNVIVDSSGLPKLLDFGVARLVNSEGKRTGFHTETGNLVGTFAYMSPEQATGCGDQVGVQSDIYQVALMLFELLTGQLPYENHGGSAAAVFRAVLLDPRVSLSQLRPDLAGSLCDLLQSALSVDPALRPQSIRDFESQLAQAVQILALRNPHLDIQSQFPSLKVSA